MKKEIKIMFGFFYLIVLGLAAFLYRFIGNFPIGDDPAVHIQTVKISSYLTLWKSNYPLPLSIFKFFGQVTHIPYQNIFVSLICAFLLFSALAFWLLAKKISGSNIIACLSALIFVSSYWTYDCLRMGLLPQTFSFAILFLALYFLLDQNIIGLAIFSLLLPFSHPYSFAVFVLFFVLYAAVNLIFSPKKDKIFVLKMLAIYAAAVALALIVRPVLIHKFSSFVNPEVIGWGERNFFVWFWASQPRRIFLALFAIIGLVASLKYWKEEKFKVLFVLFFVGLFMAFNQYFGIRFQVFRFAPYLEMPLAIFAALGILRLTEICDLKKNWRLVAVAVLSLFILVPQVYANERVTYGMSQIPANNNTISVGDRAAIDWLAANAGSKNILAPYHRSIWILALTDLSNVQSNDGFYSSGNAAVLASKPDYIFWPTIVWPAKSQIFNNPSRYARVFDQGGTVIFRVNHENN